MDKLAAIKQAISVDDVPSSSEVFFQLEELYCDSWQTKYMTTRWGTCNTNTRKIWLNLQLAKKPIECLEYVILHELAHLKVKNHGADFVAILDQHMPYWKDIRQRLNTYILDPIRE